MINIEHWVQKSFDKCNLLEYEAAQSIKQELIKNNINFHLCPLKSLIPIILNLMNKKKEYLSQFKIDNRADLVVAETNRLNELQKILDKLKNNEYEYFK
jgi:hypothetical protein